ncbi:MAG: outer membrane protein assembly factor BamB family protein [Candidatus Helarchaeota archaeon]
MKFKKNLFGIIILLGILISSYVISIEFSHVQPVNLYNDRGNKITNLENNIPENVEITKTESMTVNINPFGKILEKHTTVTFTLRNLGNKRVTFQLKDRVEKAEPRTFQIIRGSFDEEPKVIFIDNGTYGYMLFKFPNITLEANSRKEFGYIVKTKIEVPYTIHSTFYINNTKIELNESEEDPKIMAPIGSKITQVINIQRVDKGLFGINSMVRAPNIVLLTVILPYSEREEDMDISEPEYSSPPVMENALGFIQQISWIVYSNNYTVNWSAKILSGGGWGILELQPMMIVITKATDMTSTALQALNGVLGLIAGLQGYWIGLVADSLIEEFMTLSSYMNYIFDIMAIDSSIMNMGVYSMINNLIISLVEANIVRQFLQDSISTIDGVIDDIGGSFPLDAINLINVQTTLNNSLDYIADMERRITASFGAQIIQLLGNPAVITIRKMPIMDIIYLDYLFINATASELPDNQTDFYTKIDIENLTAINGLVNLSRTYEFKLGNSTGFFYLLDQVFGRPIFKETNVSGSPNSTAPGIYTSYLSMLTPDEGSFWYTLGNLSRSIATQLLLLNSSFGGKYKILLKNQSANVNISSKDPFILETGFTGLNSFMNSFKSIQKKYQSPYGNPPDVYIPEINSNYNNMPFGGNLSKETLNVLNNMSFNTQMQIYMEPNLYIRNTLNFSLPIGSLGNLTSNFTGTVPIEVADYVLEDGTKPDWVNSTMNGVQFNNATDSIFKRFIVNGICNFSKSVLVPGKKLMTNFRINSTDARIDLIIYDENSTIKKYNLQDLMSNINDWNNFTWDLSNPNYWNYYDNNFDNDYITKFEFIINSTNPVAFDIDYMNMTRTVLPYPNNITLYEGYVYSNGIEPFGNVTKYKQLNGGLEIPYSFIADVCGGSDNEVIAGSTDENIYVFNGTTGNQLWNLTLNGHITDMFVQDFIKGGKNEIILGLDNGSVLVLNGTGSLIWNYSFSNTINYMAIGDINNDSLDELVVGADDTILVALNNSGNYLWNDSLKNTITDIKIVDINGDNKSEILTSSLANSVKCFNGSTGEFIWKKRFYDDVLKIVVGNFTGDKYNDIVAYVKPDYLYAFSGYNLSDIWEIETNAYIINLNTIEVPLKKDNIVISTATNLTSYFGNNGTERWTVSTNSIITTMKVFDINSDSADEVMIGANYHNISAYLDNGSLLWEYRADSAVKNIGIGYIDNNSVYDLALGESNNKIQAVNLTSFTKLWENTLGKWILSFKFIRTSKYISIYYNLPEPITHLMQTIGVNLPEMTSLANIGSLSSLGGTNVNGLDSLSQISMNPSDLGNLGINVSFTGIGLVNILMLELDLMIYIQELSDISNYEKAFTGIPDVKYYGDNSAPDIDVFVNDTVDSPNWEYVQCDIRNNEEDPITVQYFAVILKYDNHSIPKDRIIIQGYNVTSGKWIDLNSSVIKDFDWNSIGLNYVNGSIVFKNFIEIDTDERKLVTTDWKLRQLRIKINISGLSPSNLTINTWSDCTQDLDGVTMQPISSSITINAIYPTVLVFQIPSIEIPPNPQVNILRIILTSPITWGLVLAAGIIGFVYQNLNKREKFRYNKIATNKMLKWLKKEQNKWDAALLNGTINIKKYSSLNRLRLRLMHDFRQPKEKFLQFVFKYNSIIESYKIMKDTSHIFLLKGFWRDIDQRSKLALVLDRIIHYILLPVNYILIGLFWIPKGIYKLLVKIFVKKQSIIVKKKALISDNDLDKDEIEIKPPEKTISQSSGNEELDNALSKYLKDVRSSKQKKKKKSNKKWHGKTMNDGGTTNDNKLPELETKIGKTFYFIAENKYIGRKVDEIAKFLGVSIHEVLFYLIKLYEQGLISQIKEGKTLGEDIWDVSSRFKKVDPELEKIIEKTKNLYDEVSEGIIITEAEIKNEIDEIKEEIEHEPEPEKNINIKDLEILMPKPVKVDIDLPEIKEKETKDLPTAKIEEIKE